MVPVFLAAGISCIVTGWGYYKIVRLPNGEVDYLDPDRLQYLPMKIVDVKVCKQANRPGFVNENNICASAGLNSSTYKVSTTNKSFFNFRFNYTIDMLTEIPAFLLFNLFHCFLTFI